jgi:hypothetical protein
MGNSFQIKWIFIVIFSLFAQVFILRDVALANVAFCFIYLWIIIKAPIHTPLFYLILGVDFLVDFYLYILQNGFRKISLLYLFSEP